MNITVIMRSCLSFFFVFVWTSVSHFHSFSIILCWLGGGCSFLSFCSLLTLCVLLLRFILILRLFTGRSSPASLYIVWWKWHVRLSVRSAYKWLWLPEIQNIRSLNNRDSSRERERERECKRIEREKKLRNKIHAAEEKERKHKEEILFWLLHKN